MDRVRSSQSVRATLAGQIAVLVLLLLAAGLLTACGSSSFKGKWVADEVGTLLTIDEEWIVHEDGRQARYVITGDSSMEVDYGEGMEPIRYELEGDTLTMTDRQGEDLLCYREGSRKAIQVLEAVAATEREQAEREAEKKRLAQEKEKCRSTRVALEVAFREWWVREKGEDYTPSHYDEAYIADDVRAGKFEQWDYDLAHETLLPIVREQATSGPHTEFSQSYLDGIRCPGGGEWTASVIAYEKHAGMLDVECSLHGSMTQYK